MDHSENPQSSRLKAEVNYLRQNRLVEETKNNDGVTHIPVIQNLGDFNKSTSSQKPDNLPTVTITNSNYTWYDFEPGPLNPEFNNSENDKKSINKTIDYWTKQGINAVSLPVYTSMAIDLLTRNKKFSCTRFVLGFYGRSLVKCAKAAAPKVKELAKRKLGDK